jgi:hypothetical protein
MKVRNLLRIRYINHPGSRQETLIEKKETNQITTEFNIIKGELNKGIYFLDSGRITKLHSKLLMIQ